MKKGIKAIIICALIISLLSIQAPCFAQNMLRKLGRGAANMTTSILELPKSIEESLYNDGPIAACTYGVLDGIFKGVIRTVVGAFEVVTFPIPIPADYAPIVEPEFLFSSDEAKVD